MKKIRNGFLLLFAAAFMAIMCAFAASCDDGKVKLSFHTDGGSECAVIEELPGAQVTLPTPTKGEADIFDGWYTSSDFSGPAYRGTITVPEQDTVYYAKWETGYLVTLDPDGGSLDRTSFYLKAGDSVYDAVREYVPVKGQLTFGGWFDGDSAITASRRMPAAPLTLTAKYKVDYTIRVHLQSLYVESDYEQSTEYSRTLSDFVGAVVSGPEPSVTGFVLDGENNGYPTSVTLTESPAANVLDFYYNRAKYTVTYDLNPPSGVTVSGRISAQTDLVFGSSFTAAENPYTAEGYRFAGWATVPGGKAEFRAGEEIEVSGYMTLFAVWDLGHIDRYGSYDLIFLPQMEPGVAILSRGGYEVRGTLEGDLFSIELPNGSVVEGKIFGNFFSYKREQVEGFYVSYSPYSNVEDRLDTSNTLDIDSYQDATYTERDELTGEMIELKGAVTALGPDGYEYVFLITEGENAGSGFNFRLAELADHTLVFERSLGEGGYYSEFVNASGSYVQGYNLITLDGFGTMYYTDNYTGVYEAEGTYYVDDLYYSDDGRVLFLIVGDVVEEYGGTNHNVHLEFYTFYLSDYQMDAYIMNLFNAGTASYEPSYSGRVEGEEASLTLDGYEVLFNSAELVIGGETYHGAYTYSHAALGSEVIAMQVMELVPATEGGSTADFRYQLDEILYFELVEENGRTVFVEYHEEEREFVTYYRMLDGLYMPLLAIYESAAEGGRKAELYWQDQSTGEFVLAAEGYYTTERLGGQTRGVDLYTFRRTRAIEGYDSLTPTMMKFATNTVTNAGGSVYNIYYVFEIAYGEQEEIYYKVISEKNGTSTMWQGLSLATPDMGTLYFRNGLVYDGGLTIETNYWGTQLGTFQWINGTLWNYFYFEFELDAGGNIISFTPIDFVPSENPMFYVTSTGTMDTMNATLILYDLEKGDSGNAIYAPTGTWSSGTFGRYEVTGETALGDPIYTFFDGQARIFDFVFRAIDYNDYGTIVNIYQYWRVDAGATALSGEFTGDGCGTLTLDGFYRAEYIDGDGRLYLGTYSLDRERNAQAVYFTANDGTVFIFEIAGGTISPLDAAYGEYLLRTSDAERTIRFDGKGQVTLHNRDTGADLGVYGRYTILDERNLEVRVTRFQFETGGASTHIMRLQNGECLLHQDTQSGVFTDPEFNLLILDGYGRGTYYSADGSAGRSGYLFMLDEFDGDQFGFLRFDNFEELFFMFDTENGSFRLAEYPDEDFVYFSEDFSTGISYGADHFVYYGNGSGYYYIDSESGTVRAYMLEGGYTRKTQFPLPGADTITYNGTRLYRYRGEQVVLSGTIAFDSEGVKNATLSFRPTGEMLVRVNATLTVDMGEGARRYSVYFTNYRSTGINRFDWQPFILYNNAFSPFETFKYVSGAQGNGFTAKELDVGTIRYDDYDTAMGTATEDSSLEIKYRGFGPVSVGETVIEGTLYYAPVMRQGRPLTFTADPENVVEVADDSVNGTRYMITFTAGGVDYAMQYYTPESGYYILYMLLTYQRVEAGDYSVGAGRFVYTNAYDLYGGYREGDLCSATLFKGESVVIPFISGVGYGGKTAWLVDIGTYSVDEYSGAESGELGDGYFIEFGFENDRIVSAEVTVYEFRQAQDLNGNYAFNYFLGEDGEPEMLVSMVAWSNEESQYVFQTIVSSEVSDSGMWTITTTSATYTVTFLLDAEGNRQVASDGESWVARVTRVNL